MVHGLAGGKVFTSRLLPTTHRDTPSLPLAIVDAAARYRVELVVPEGIARATLHTSTAPFFEALADGGVTLDGAWLVHSGLPMLRSTAESCVITRLRKI